jgi:hypothetical protein
LSAAGASGGGGGGGGQPSSTSIVLASANIATVNRRVFRWFIENLSFANTRF